MRQIFIETLNNAWIASWLILAVMAVRLLLKRIPRYIYCILWGLVGLKLMFPFDIRSAFSLLPGRKTIETASNGTSPVIVRTGIGQVDSHVNEYISTFSKSQPMPHDAVVDWVLVLSLLWILGIICMISYLLFSYILMRRKVAGSMVIEKGVSICDEIKSPFLFGVLKPHIYLPSGLDKNGREYVLLHERMHLKRGDHLWKPLGFMVLAVYWFHPLCWISYFLLCRDIELACDEMVIQKKDDSWRANYCQVLLDCSVGKQKMIVVPLAFGEVGVKERVKRVLSFKRTKLGVVIAAIIICAGVAICFGTKPNEKEIVSSNDRKDNTDHSIPFTEPTVDLSEITGADGARLYYADEDTIIFGGYFGLFVYDTKKYKYIGSVDLKSIGCENTQGDNVCTIQVKSDGSEVYLHQDGIGNKEVMYVYHVKDNKLTQETYDLDEKNLFSGVHEDLVSAAFDCNGRKEECFLRNAWKTIGELGYKYSSDDKVYPLFLERRLQGSVFLKPEEVTDIVKAEITYEGTHYVCTEQKILKMLEEGLQNGKKTKGLSSCPFDDVMFLTKDDGSVGMLVPAMDGCKACLLEGGYYELDESMSISFYDLINKGLFEREEITSADNPSVTKIEKLPDDYYKISDEPDSGKYFKVLFTTTADAMLGTIDFL